MASNSTLRRLYLEMEDHLDKTHSVDGRVELARTLALLEIADELRWLRENLTFGDESAGARREHGCLERIAMALNPTV